MIFFLFKGILIGLLFGIPVGAVGTMTVHRTLKFGMRAGLFTGMGSSAADCIYAAVGVFGLTVVSEFLLKHQVVITLIGGIFIMGMGGRLILKEYQSSDKGTERVSVVQMFLSSFTIGITNPAAIITFLWAFTYFEIVEVESVMKGIFLVCGVFAGTYMWWLCLTTITYVLAKKRKNCEFVYMNKIFGAILILFGAIIILRK